MKAAALLTTVLMVAPLTRCDDMTRQGRLSPYSASQGEPLTPPAATVSFHDAPVTPPPVSMALLRRGQAEYRVYCTPCHSELGDGHGIVVQRGFPPPPSYHSDRLRAADPAHFDDVITHGYGAMYSFAARVQPADRWAIAAYIKALQRSQDATVADVPAAAQGALK
jgi:mono/diheme cytochrome c family protein